MKRKIFKWASPIFALALVVSLIAVAFPVAVGGIAPGEDEPINTLRVYGECDEGAIFPYGNYTDPFDLTDADAPDRDFVVFNPAYMYHGDTASLGIYGNYFLSAIKADGDANEKVHLRMWYQPKYLELLH